MKTTIKLFVSISLILLMFACRKDDGTTTPTTPDYQVAIQAKFKALGWDKDGHTLSGDILKTPGGKGYVQYYTYSGRKTAIYYFDGKGAFAMDTNEMNKYEAIGADNFAFVVSDPKPSGTGSGHNEIVKIADNTDGIIITTPGVGTFVIYGDIYKKYLALNRWTGPLGYPLNDETNLSSGRGRWNAFAKTGNIQTGQIYYSTTTGAQAWWGKIETLYGKTGYDTGWLGLPTTSCDLNIAEGKQYVRFEKGAIDGANCGNYYNSSGLLRYQNGATPASGALPPCY